MWEDDFNAKQSKPLPLWLRKLQNWFRNASTRFRRHLPPWVIQEADITLKRRTVVPWGSCVSLGVILWRSGEFFFFFSFCAFFLFMFVCRQCDLYGLSCWSCGDII